MAASRTAFGSIALIFIGLGIAFAMLQGALSQNGVSRADPRWSYAEVGFTFERLGTSEKERLEAALQAAESVLSWKVDVPGLEVEVTFDFRKLDQNKLEDILRDSGLLVKVRGSVQYIQLGKEIKFKAWLDAPSYQPGSSAKLTVEATPGAGLSIAPNLILVHRVEFEDHQGSGGFGGATVYATSLPVRLSFSIDVLDTTELDLVEAKISLTYNMIRNGVKGPRKALDRWVPLRIGR